MGLEEEKRKQRLEIEEIEEEIADKKKIICWSEEAREMYKTKTEEFGKRIEQGIESIEEKWVIMKKGKQNYCTNFDGS